MNPIVAIIGLVSLAIVYLLLWYFDDRDDPYLQDDD